MKLIRIGDPLPARGWDFDGIVHINRNGPAFIASKYWPARIFEGCCNG